MTTNSKAKEIIIRQACKDEVILDLCNVCLKTKSPKKSQEIKLYLENNGFPILADYKGDFLESLKRKKIIEDLKLDEEEETRLEVIDEPEPDMDRFPLISEENLNRIPKETSIMEYPQGTYIAIVKCQPQKVLKYLADDLRRIREDIEIESSFEKGRVLKCGKLKFELESGNAIYGGTRTNFMPDKEEYKFLKFLMENSDHRMNYEQICKAVYGSEKWANMHKKPLKREISFIARNIKRKLEMIGKNPKNQNLISAHNGYIMTDVVM